MQNYLPMFIKEHDIDGHTLIKQVRKVETSDLIVKCNGFQNTVIDGDQEALFTGYATELLCNEIRELFSGNESSVPMTLHLLFKDNELAKPQKFAAFIDIATIDFKGVVACEVRGTFESALNIGAAKYQAALEKGTNEIVETIQMRIDNTLLLHNQLYARALHEAISSDTRNSKFISGILTDFDKANIGINNKAISELQESMELLEGEINTLRRSNANIRAKRIRGQLDMISSSENQEIMDNAISIATRIY
ncbi:hypothetical protein VCHA53O466_140155 [Vibrio chagasii]|nr:hypothetical protein VCHA53O466_140155 [Vibrio chagasii]